MFAQKKFVAVGDGGIALSSFDGVHWATNNSTTTAHLNGLVYGAGVFLAVGVNGTMIVSTDGVHWQPNSLNTTETFTSVAYGDGYFVAVDLDGDIISSPDLAHWTVQYTVPDNSLLTVAYGDHSFMAVGLGGVVVQSDPFINAGLVKISAPGLSITGPNNRRVSIQTTTNLSSSAGWNTAASISLTNQPTLWMDTQAPPASSRFYRVLLSQ